MLSHHMWVSSEKKGAGPGKSHKVECARGTALLKPSFLARCPGFRGPFWEERHKSEFWIQPGSWWASMAPTPPGVKQEKGLKPGLCAVVGDAEATQDTRAMPCASLFSAASSRVWKGEGLRTGFFSRMHDYCIVLKNVFKQLKRMLGFRDGWRKQAPSGGWDSG